MHTTYPGLNSGQVGFPGGGAEEMDDDLAATAIRETYEEIGVHPSKITLLGQLTPLYVFASNYIVQPTVAWTDYRPEFKHDPFEVAQLLEVSLLSLLDPATRRTETRTLRGQPIEVPYFAVAGQTVWGATAMMLSELLALPSMKLAPGL